jgi:hypothetical protein
LIGFERRSDEAQADQSQRVFQHPNVLEQQVLLQELAGFEQLGAALRGATPPAFVFVIHAFQQPFFLGLCGRGGEERK